MRTPPPSAASTSGVRDASSSRSGLGPEFRAFRVAGAYPSPVSLSQIDGSTRPASSFAAYVMTYALTHRVYKVSGQRRYAYEDESSLGSGSPSPVM